MKRFEPVSNPFEYNFFTIFVQNGVKIIHIHGYIYNIDGSWNEWAYMECCGLHMPLKEFVDRLHGNEDFIDEIFEQAKQYQKDLTAEETVQLINGYFNGQTANHILPFKDITKETPCGHYVC